MGDGQIHSRTRRPWKHDIWTYCRYAHTHPVHLVILGLAAIGAVVAGNLLVPLLTVACVEACVLAALPRSASFRREVERRIDETARAAAATERAMLIARMTTQHRAELEALERLGSVIRSRSATTSADDWVGIERLLMLYVRVAIAYRASAEAFRAADKAQLELAESQLAYARETASGASRDWIERRLSVVSSRLSTCTSALRAQDVMAQELATIAELVRWMHDECVASDARSLDNEVEGALDVCRQSANALRELSALRIEGDTINPRVIALDAEDLAPARSEIARAELVAETSSLAHLPHLRL
jgi:HAMP domain-containing protein